MGLDAVVRLVLEGGRPAVFLRLTGRSEEEWRRDWLSVPGETPTGVRPDLDDP